MSIEHSTVTAQDYASKVIFNYPEMDSDLRLRELILYISDKCVDDPTFGVTKLNKILAFADFASFAVRGNPITGAEYMKLGKGPVPRRMIPIRKELEAEQDIIIKKRDYYSQEQHRVIALKQANLDIFNAHDIALVDDYIRLLWGKTAKEVSEMSHGMAWQVAENKDLIPYQAMLLSEEGITEEDIAEAQELINQHAWTDI